MCEPKEWTLMFYFATDNPLAISAVSQLKAIKDAGFHPNANVVAQFDPYTEGTPTHVFDVNVVNKLKAHGAANIGFNDDDGVVVRSLIEDKLWRNEETTSPPPAAAGATTSNHELVRNALNRVLQARYHINYKPPFAPNVSSTFNPVTDRMEEPGAQTSLREFLRFCADKYPARHYMLFMLGHGVVVGNDIFMLDEHASEQSLTLTEMGEILAEFKHTIELEGSKFDLVSFFKSLDDRSGTPINMRDLMFDIYHDCMLNSADYLLAGYSFQLTLCDLERVRTTQSAIDDLAAALKDGVANDPTTADFILLSHWKSQSFFNEMYTDLYDFCFCLSTKINDLRKAGGRPTPALIKIEVASIEVMKKLVKENPKNPKHPDLQQLIVASDYLGPAFQYSRGLSVYFPWSEPPKDSPILSQYRQYRFSRDFKNSWLDFLRAYFDSTQRAVSS